ncbi:chemotaxis protein CheR [Phycisphaerae bacterium]|nr:chemotaxis protein CheR [Phycisphaerae bacterium]
MSSSQTQRDILWIARFLTERASLAPGLLDGPAFASAVRGRMSQLAMTDIAKYAAVVEQNENEMECLASEVAVPETWFFRYPASFEFLRAQLANRKNQQQEKLVCASLGCATGVEAWCIASCALSVGWAKENVIVHAIDRSPLAITSAREGRIPGGSLRSTLPEWAEPWIRAESSSVIISREVLECVRFQQEDLLLAKDLFSQPIDALFCRNVMIYLDPAARILLRDRIVNWTANDGIVFLGHADGLERGAVLESAGPTSAFAWRRSVATTVTDTKGKTRPRIMRPNAIAPIAPKVSTASRANPVQPKPLSKATVAQRVQPMLAAREFSHAQRLVEDALKVTPANIELLELLAGIFCSKNELQLASQTYARVVYLEPHHGPALLALAELSDALGRSDEASRYRAKMKRLGNL